MAKTKKLSVVDGGGETPAAPAKKTKCPFSRAEMEALEGTPVTIKVGDREVLATFRGFSTGSFGFFLSDKLELELDGKRVKLQANINLTVVGSKDAE
jgi:hypothetical protein